MSQKESEWELKFHEKIKENTFVTPSSHLDVEEIRSFILETLYNREKEIAEEVEKILENYKVKEEPLCEQNVLIKIIEGRILSILKH